MTAPVPGMMTTFGTKVIISGTGVVMNNEMDAFSAQPGVPNVFGLVGAEANAVEPGKRPLSSMSPTIVLREGQPIFSVGAAGGPTIISQTVLAILYSLDYGMDLETALAQPRFHHQWKPDQLTVEERMDRENVKHLEKMGHTIHHVRSMGVTQAIARDPETGRFTGAHDPRVNGEARVWKAQGQRERK
jgi:gamma-glutamyltranspeptidase/glutathione hydrolase